MSVCAGAKRHRLNPRAYLNDLLDELSEKPSYVNHLLPDASAPSTNPPAVDQ